MMRLLEVCAGSFSSALAGQQGGADRIELCDNLAEGGTTPSFGTIKVCKSELNIPVFPIIRPRGGNFVYSNAEFEAMKMDIECCRELKCEGVVTGILLSDGSVDQDRCTELVELAGGMQVTFHRAFDRCTDMFSALEVIVKLGFTRILTSGGKPSAADATAILRELVERASDRIIIMPGAGLTESNLHRVAVESQAVEFHSTAKNPLSPNPESLLEDLAGLYQTNPEIVSRMKKILDF